MKYLKATLLGSGALASLLLSSVLTSCQDEDFGFTSEEIRAAAYDRNFVAKYGEIAPDQSWDLSSYAVDFFKSGAATRALGNANECKFDNDENSWLNNRISIVEDWYYTEPQLIAEFNSHLGEGVDNTSQGGPFSLSSNGTPFYIIPVFQGVSGIISDLHMVVTYNGQTYDKQIWDKSQNLEKQDAGNMNWSSLGSQYDPWSTYGGKSEYEANYTGSTYGALATRTKPIKCMIPAGATIKFYLHITKGHLRTATKDGNEILDNDLAFTDSKQWSDKGKMIALNENFTVNQATKDRFGKEVYIIGCEDASYGTEDVAIYNNDGTVKKTYHVGDEYDGPDSKKGKVTQWSGDNDMNDLVFMFIADELPEIVEEGVVKKRYLIEDLGSVVDWDFNDVVVDMYQKSEDGKIVEQKAMIRQKCGTTDFDIFLKINGTRSASLFGRHQGEVRWSSSNDDWKQPMAENASGTVITYVDLSSKKINGQWPWDPDENNIQILVYPETNRIDESQSGYKGEGNGLSGGNNGGYGYGGVNSDTSDPTNQNMSNSGLLVEFPERGSVPRIIAVDTDFPWTAENQDIDPSIWTYYVIDTNVEMQSGVGDPGVVAGAGRYRAGSSVTLKAIPNPGYDFVYWKDNNSNVTESREITVLNATTYTAIFKQSATPNQDFYTVKVRLENGGTLQLENGVSAESGSGTEQSPYIFKIPTVVDGKPNDTGIYLTAVNGSKVFSHWSDENGNMHTLNGYRAMSDADLIAHFVDQKTLTIRIDQEDWKSRDVENHPIELFLKDGSTYKRLTIDDNGMATQKVTNDKVTVIANVKGLNQWDVVFQWSEGGSKYETQNVTTYSGDGHENGLPGNFDKVSNQTKNEITVPSEGKVMMVGVTYQVLAFLTRRSATEITGSTVYHPNNFYYYYDRKDGSVKDDDVPYGTVKINGENKRQLYLHHDAVFNLEAIAKPGYHFVEWHYFNETKNLSEKISESPILRNQQISRTEDNGMYTIDAVFEENTLRTLTLQLDNSNDQDESLKFEVNGRQATSQGNGKYTVQVAEGAQLKITATHNSYTDNSKKNLVQFELSNGQILENTVAKTLNNYMPDYNLTINISNILYRIDVVLKDQAGAVRNNAGKIKINNVERTVIYVPEGSNTTYNVRFEATANYGFTFNKWNKLGSNSYSVTNAENHFGHVHECTIEAIFNEDNTNWAIDLRSNPFEINNSNKTYDIKKNGSTQDNHVNFVNLLSATKRTISFEFTNIPSVGGRMNVFFENWQTNIGYKDFDSNWDGKMSVTLTEEQAQAFKDDPSKPIFIQYYKDGAGSQTIKLKLVTIDKTN